MLEAVAPAVKTSQSLPGSGADLDSVPARCGGSRGEFEPTRRGRHLIQTPSLSRPRPDVIRAKATSCSRETPRENAKPPHGQRHHPSWRFVDAQALRCRVRV